jgi:hypothetical protein
VTVVTAVVAMAWLPLRLQGINGAARTWVPYT